MSKGGLLYALAGAGGTSYVMNNGDAFAPLRGVPGLGGYLPSNSAFTGAQWGSVGDGGSAQEMQHLKRLVEQLRGDLGRQPAGFTIVNNGGSKGGYQYWTITAMITGVGLVYLRVFRGWRLTDMLYVTRSGMEGFRSALQTQVDSVKAKLETRLEHMRAKQSAMADNLRNVGEDVGNVRDEVGNVRDDVGNVNDRVGAVQDEIGNVNDNVLQLEASVHNSVRELENNLDDIAIKQETANEGIKLLCSVVGDLMNKAGYRVASVVELDKYVKRPRVSGSPRVQGLEGLLAGAESSSGHMSRRSSEAFNPSSELMRAARMRQSPDMDRTSTV